MSKKFSASNAGLFTSFYSKDNLFNKIGNVAKSAGAKAIYAALLLYYAMYDEEVPIKDKVIVIGALGYFILPVDLIPDVLIGVGYTDDIGAMVLALKSIWTNVTPNTKAKARNRLTSWFSSIDPADLKLF